MTTRKPESKLVAPQIGEFIWIPDEKSVYERAKILEDHIVANDKKDSLVKVKTMGKVPEERTLLRSQCYDVDATHMIDLDDLIEMNSLHEAPLLDVLRRRWIKDNMYTYTGDFLVSINPYHLIEGQNDNPLKYLDLSQNMDKKKVLSPHVFAIANNALRAMVKTVLEEGERVSQSIIVTGESGAGKTEASKQVMKFLTRSNTENVSFEGAEETAEQIMKVILDSNSIFEAFGNAKTVRNDNSSRFGKYIRLQYTADNQLWSAQTETFLLEKSRLVSVSKDDRNYHIFYQMVRGLDSDTKARLGLKSVDIFKILTDGGSTVITTEQDDINEFEVVGNALPLMGCTSTEITRIWEVLACCLHLGNIVCETGPAPQHLVTLSSPSLPIDQITKLFGVNEASFITALTSQAVKVGTEVHQKNLTAEETKNNINALIKWVYGALFNWIVSKVNTAHKAIATTQKKEVVKFIGILDIFGFEIFAKNNFEQLCINYANERLQQQFNEIAFELEQQQYKKEGLDWANITYRDNQPVIDLIGKKPQGLLIILEEHSLMNRDPDDQALLNTYNRLHFGNHPNYAKPRFGSESFVIKHFAGDVEYLTDGFLSKNNDALQKDLAEQLVSSTDDFLLSILNSNLGGSGETSRFSKDSANKIASVVSVSNRFRTQLDNLMATLRSTKAFYIKCIKPNNEKKKGIFNSQMVITQLRYSGVLEIVRIRREGYPTRLTYNEFYEEYTELFRATNTQGPANISDAEYRKNIKELLTKFTPVDSFQLGKTFVFLHHYVTQNLLIALNSEKKRRAIKIQANWRGHSAYQKYNRRYKSTILIQSILRMAKAKKQVKKEVENEIIRLMELERIEIERRKEEERKLAEMARRKEEERVAEEKRTLEEKQRLKAIEIQSVFRGHLERKGNPIDKQFAAVRRIQKAVRTFIRNRRNQNMIVEFHKKCKAGETEKAKQIIVKSDACIYRNKWDNYCTMYQSAGSNGKIRFLKDFAISPNELLERDVKGGRMLHYAMQSRELSFVKYLSEVMSEVKTTVVVNIKEDDEDDENEPKDSIVNPSFAEAPVAPGTVDTVTGLPIIKAGWLKKSTTLLGFRTWRRRWAVLTEESFILYKAVNKKPAGYINIESCMVERAPGKEPCILLSKPGVFSKNEKKGAMFGGSKNTEHDHYTMKAESEIVVQEWLTALKIAAGVRPFRDGPIAYLNLVVRHNWVQMLTSSNQSPLHLLAGLAKDAQTGKEDEIIRIAAWLLENGCNIESIDKNKKTAMEIAKTNKNTSLAEFLTKRQESLQKSSRATLTLAVAGMSIDPNVAKSRIITSALIHEQQKASTGTTSDPQKLLLAMKSKGFSYLQFNLEKLINAGGKKTDFTGLVNPRLWISVHNGKGDPIEVIQEIEVPAITNKDSLWWGYNWYMQTPIENIGSDFTVTMRFVHGTGTPLNSALLPTVQFPINKETIDSMSTTFSFSSPAAATGGVPVVEYVLEAEIIITKFFRHLDLETALRSSLKVIQ